MTTDSSIPSDADAPHPLPLRDESVLLVALQATRFYYMVFDRQLQSVWDAELDQFIVRHVVPRVANASLRDALLAGLPRTTMILGPRMQADQIYDQEFETQEDYVAGLSRFMDTIVEEADPALVSEILRFYVTIGNRLAVLEHLTVQDRFFPVFLLLRRAPDPDWSRTESVLSEVDDDTARQLLRQASGRQTTLVARERLALVLYDMMLLREEEGFDIKLADIARAKRLIADIPLRDKRTTAHPEHEEWTALVGTFEDNFAAEIFGFFNAGLLAKDPQDDFHAFCLACWTTLQPELDGDARDRVLEALATGFGAERDRSIKLIGAYREAVGMTPAGAPASESGLDPEL